ncbi:MAG TPA: hypothetical protein VKE27_03855 [Candidatus Dormibacteraeota bacterium]|nr:hypothetical protein [Candidatus Dormibacteraeota bacterium]
MLHITHPSARNGTESSWRSAFSGAFGESARPPGGNAVRKHTFFMWAGATLALALTAASACGNSTSSNGTSASSSCVNASATHHAYVVVEHGTATHQVQKCVGFSGDVIDGQTLMDQSGIQYQTQTFSFGKAVCQIDKEPAQYSSCFANSGPNWLLFVDTGGSWATAQTGYAQITLHDKEALGWEYTAVQSPSPPPLPKE